MKYEFIFKVKPFPRATSYKVKYRCVVNADRYNLQKSCYEKVKSNHPEWDSVILINELTDFNEFVRVIQ